MGQEEIPVMRVVILCLSFVSLFNILMVQCRAYPIETYKENSKFQDYLLATTPGLLDFVKSDISLLNKGQDAGSGSDYSAGFKSKTHKPRGNDYGQDYICCFGGLGGGWSASWWQSISWGGSISGFWGK